MVDCWYVIKDAKFYKSNPAATHRLMPWLTREFKVIVGEENTSFMIALVNSMLNKLVYMVSIIVMFTYHQEFVWKMR